jgi:NAD(P)-dependent dehydrogenase (short-subunit alcohol dehydrogenase family)
MAMGRVEGKTAIVTGAARGIGRAIAIGLSEEGADIAVVDLDATTSAKAVESRIRELGRRALLIDADVSKVADCYRMVKETIDNFGQLDILVNNAGGGRYQKFEEITEDDYDAMLGVNLKAAFFASQAVVPHMSGRGKGKIVNIGSEQAYIGYALLPHYTAAKGGILALTRSLALSLAPNINVNTVSPGPTATEKLKAGPEYIDEVREQIPLKRWVQPEDVARTVVFLASADGDIFTGQTLDPNAGTVMP